MNYANIKYYDIANGPGVRTSLFVSGCTHRCKGCFNEVAWDFNYGEVFTQKVVDEILESMEGDYIEGLTLLGGEPMEPVNQRGLSMLLNQMHEKLPNKDVWCYTGYVYDKDLRPGGRAYCEMTDDMLSRIDVLVDGEFIQDQYDISLRFRGSRNQRVIDLRRTEQAGNIVLWKDQEIYDSHTMNKI